MELIGKYIIAITGIIGLMVGWTIVQQLWHTAFPDQHIDEDVLAGRSDCGSCGCTTPCVIKKTDKNKR
jgi:hypothetical protein